MFYLGTPEGVCGGDLEIWPHRLRSRERDEFFRGGSPREGSVVLPIRAEMGGEMRVVCIGGNVPHAPTPIVEPCAGKRRVVLFRFKRMRRRRV